MLVKEFKPDMDLKSKSDKMANERQKEKAKQNAAKAESHEIKTEIPGQKPKILGKIDLEALSGKGTAKTKEPETVVKEPVAAKPEPEKPKAEEPVAKPEKKKDKPKKDNKKDGKRPPRDGNMPPPPNK